MPSERVTNIALVGNPNSGKSTLFNRLTGLNQKTGNFPGVTVEKKVGHFTDSNGSKIKVTDLPGLYSIFPKSYDEQIVFDFLNDPNETPDVIVVVADATNLRRNLLLFTQLYDLNIPLILALSMLDVVEKDKSEIDIDLLKDKLNIPIIPINSRSGKGIKDLKDAIEENTPINNKTLIDVKEISGLDSEKIEELGHNSNPYRALANILYEERQESNQIINKDEVKEKEITLRYKIIDSLLENVIKKPVDHKHETLTSKLDKILIHKVWGILIFAILLLLVFQAVFTLAAYPMDWIDQGFAMLIAFSQENLPEGVFFDLLTEGILSGIGGVVIFIPQIAILFALLSLLEESGYMTRVVYMMDKFMQRFGLNGRSVVPLVSGAACAIPAVMSARSISNWKERIITIFVTPLISCSARIPVYAILIALVIPETYIFGIINLQGLTLFGLYLLGFVAAMLSALGLKFIIKSKELSYFIMEFPRYKVPQLKNVGLTIYTKTRSFVFEAGKVIIAISTILWVLASYGPGNKMEQAERIVTEQFPNIDEAEKDKKVAAKKIEYSYAGHLGKKMEPIIEPLGFNWKIGIALLTSFAAREVFVGTMATIYSVEDDANEVKPLKARMNAEINPKTGKKVYTLPVGLSLMVFYAFAMQCMSTLAVVYKETNSWKWPMLQLIYMTLLAYISSLIVFNLFS